MDIYKQHALIPPSQADRHIATKHTRIVIDSKDRNTTYYPEPNCYEIKLDDDIEDVTSVQLLNIDLPLPNYLINKYFNTFQIIISPQGAIDVVLDNGNYSAIELAQHITTKLNMIPGISQTFEVLYDNKKDNYIFSSSSGFALSFEEPNSLDRLLGFKSKIYITNTSPFQIASEYRRNFEYNNYVIMKIAQFDINKSSGNTLHRTFAVIGPHYRQLNISDDPKIIKTFTPALARLASIRVSFVDRFGNPYDFQNMDHRFELLFTSHKTKIKYVL